MQETLFPPAPDLWRALEWVPPESCRAVILGQDPYPTPGYAHGLSFSVPPGQRVPASLRTIFRELQRSVPGWKPPAHGCLEPWARQGVLLLNRILTVRARAPLSHAGWGWEAFTDAVIRHLQQRSDFTVFLLWGSKAQAVRPLIDENKHAVLAGSHPSPMAQNHLPPERRFVGNGHFVSTNARLGEHGWPPIDWSL